MEIEIHGNVMRQMLKRALYRAWTVSKPKTKRRPGGYFWRMCMCGKEFSAYGRKRKAERMKAEKHIMACRKQSRERMAQHANCPIASV